MHQFNIHVKHVCVHDERQRNENNPGVTKHTGSGGLAAPSEFLSPHIHVHQNREGSEAETVGSEQNPEKII